MNWYLSPRWHIENDSPPLLVGPGDQRLALTPRQYEAIRTGRLGLSPLASSAEFPEIFRWARQLIASRALVPEYLATGLSEEREAEDFYMEVFQLLCRRLDFHDILPGLCAGIRSWSGSVLKQPLGAPPDYLPTRPALCIDLLGSARRSVRVALDCRDPLLTPWENIALARQTFERHLKYRTGLFHRICELVFREPSDFTNPRVKYLHPAIEYLADGEEISAYWNLGNAGSRQELWRRSSEIIEATGGDADHQMRFKEVFGAFSQPELVGHTFDPRKPPVLKTYIMLDGLNREILREILALENVLLPGAPVLEVLRWLEENGLTPGRNLGIASLYHSLDDNAISGIKIHLNLSDGFERRFSMDTIASVVSRNSDAMRRLPNPLTETLILEDGRPVRLSPNTISFMLIPKAGLTKITLYADFLA